MGQVNLVFPNQLFKESPLLENGFPIYLVEEFLFFKQFSFHKQKILFHRATMQAYQQFLVNKELEVHYINSFDEHSEIRNLLKFFKNEGVSKISCIDPVDNWLQKYLDNGCAKHQMEIKYHESPMFLNSNKDLEIFFRRDKKKYYQTSFYNEQRRTRNILLEDDDKPVGGKWSFDAENRKKYPAKKTPPNIQFPDKDRYFEEAKDYVNNHFKNNLGSIGDQPLYAFNYETTDSWFQQFLEHRFHEFGSYEDAIVNENSILHHSVLTPMLNIGLITPNEVVEKSLAFASKNNVPINSTEGFIRQIIGWREFIRGIYVSRGSYQRTRHFWNFSKKIPKSFYDGTTGILPVDKTIQKVLKTGYCHHIERLMILGNFMMLCEFDPDEVYRWFMELFIDSYDWVMVPNVYGMSQFADGGLMSTKPYISGSNYILKMSNYSKGEWQETWDGLFWRFMSTHRYFFETNPRLRMLLSNFDRMSAETKKQHLNNAEKYLSTLE